jgi:hypothetical protein
MGKERTTMASVFFKISAKLSDVRTHMMEVFIVTILRISNFTCSIDIFEGHN